jgi:3-hydroxyacyl-[acyl-carrier-protein] dehydratase
MTSAPTIERILPHRYPMLLIDRLVEFIAGEKLTAHRRVAGDEPWYESCDGPADRAYPPLLLLESWCQAAGLLAASEDEGGMSAQAMLLGAVTNVTFYGRVLPGDLVAHHVRLVRALGDVTVLEGDATVGNRLALSVGQVVIAIRPIGDLSSTASPLSGTTESSSSA